MADENTKNYKTSEDYNIGMENAYFPNIKYVDAVTGEAIDMTTITDSIRLARAGTNIKDDPNTNNSIVHSESMPNDLLAKFVTQNAVKYSPADAVSCLGLYITDYIVDRITSLGDKNSDLSKNSSEFTDVMTFRDYNKGGSSEIIDALTGKTENPTDDNQKALNTRLENQEQYNKKKAERLSANCGIGLGESYVLNPTFQFNKRDDARTNPMYTKIGRVYSTQLMTHWPVALIQPGRFKYNTGFFKLLGLGPGAGMQEALIRSGGDGIKGLFLKFLMAPIDAISVIGTIGSAIFGGNKVLEFKQTYNMFNQYTKYLFHSLAGMMGLMQSGRYLGARESLNLYDILPVSALGGDSKVMKYKNCQYLPFRCGKAITATETFSNATTANPLEEALNSQAQQADENSSSAGAQAASGDVMGAVKTGAKKFGMGVIGNFSEQALVMSGKGRVSLPEVFSSSSFSRSFSFDFKFHSPYGDNLSIFENEYIPFLILLALSAPRQIGKMTYTSPFAVRISVKNKVMINYGLVESLSVTRGGDANDWTPSGYPKTMTCSLSVKDLEPNISLPLASRGPIRAMMETMFPSSGISEYLASIGGLTLDEIQVFFSKKRFSRGLQMFQSTWNSTASWDYLMSTVVNTSFVSNIVSLFAATDLDNINNIMSTDTGNILDNLKDSILVKQNIPGMLAAAVSQNGRNGKNTAVQANKEEEEAILSTGESLKEGSNYTNYYPKEPV